MGFWLVDADVLANIRFALSPLLETVGSLIKLAEGTVAPYERDWLHTYRDDFRQRVAADPFSQALLEDVLGPSWIPDFITRPPRRGRTTFDAELARVRATTRQDALDDLAVAAGTPSLPAAIDVDDPAGSVADLLVWVWEETVRPDWPRRRRLLQADIVGRTARLSEEGLAGALDELSPRVRWLGAGRLQINTSDRPPRDLAGAELVLVPTTTRRSFVAWDLPVRYAIAYPAAGLLADSTATASRNAVRKLLGTTRADLLDQLEQPTSTTQLVAITGLSLGTVGHHLRVLLDAGLVERRRSGSSVLYYRSGLGSGLLAGTTLRP